MRRIGEIARSVLASLLLCAAVGAESNAAASGTDAGEKPSLIAVGEVSTNVVRSDVDLPGVLRAALAEELPTLDLSQARRRPVILSVSLVQMDTEATSAGASSTCVISATLRNKRGGNLFAVLHGRAQARDVAKERRNAERAALRSAVQGALAHLPEALAK